MAMSPDRKRTLISETTSVAATLADDLQFIRATVASGTPTSGDVRRLSNLLRRVLIDNGGDIRKVAPPRVGRIEIIAPDLNPKINSCDTFPVVVASLGEAMYHDVIFSTLIIERSTLARNIPGFSPNNIISLGLDGFLNQKVICLNGLWARRIDVIKYVANIAGGVHSGLAKEPVETLLDTLRSSIELRISNGVPSLHMNGTRPRGTQFLPQSNALDIVLFQMLATATYLVNAPQVIQLEQMINDYHA